VGMQDSTLESYQPLRPSQIADLRLAASKMTGPTRRAFQAEMALKYCGANPLLAETIFGWGRHTVEVGLAERRTGSLCLGAQSAFSGRNFYSVWWGCAMPLASRCRSCTTHPITVSIIRSSAVGVSWKGTGREPSWWTWRRWWGGLRV
jgi:hypothetical protein